MRRSLPAGPPIGTVTRVSVLDDPAYRRAATAMQSEITAMPSAAEVLYDLVGLAHSTRRIA